MMNEELGIKVCVNNAYYYLGEVKVTRNPLFLHTSRQKKFGPPSFLFSLFSSYGIETLNKKGLFWGIFFLLPFVRFDDCVALIPQKRRLHQTL